MQDVQDASFEVMPDPNIKDALNILEACQTIEDLKEWKIAFKTVVNVPEVAAAAKTKFETLNKA